MIAAQQSISSDVQAVLDGDPGQPGCLETVGAAVALEADPRWRSFAAVEAMTNGTLEAAAREPAVAAVIGAWADCLETSTGWSFAHPADPFSVFAPADAVSAEEIAVALADVACKDEVGLVAAWSAEEGRQQLELLDTESETVASAMDLQRDVLAAVMSIETD